MLKRLLVMPMFMWACMAWTQSEMSERPATEQPGFYVGAYTLYPGNVVVENTVNLQGDNSLSRNRTWAIPSTLVRYGLLDGVEVRVKGEVLHTTATIQGQDFGNTLVNAFSVGAKMKLIPAGSKLPELSLVTFFQIPRTGSRFVGPNYLAPSLLLATNFPMFQTFTGNVNLGAAWDGIGADPTYQYAFAVERGLADGLTLFAEAYGFWYTGSESIDHRYDLGLVWGLNPHLQFDLSGGVGFQPPFAYRTWFTAAGITLRAIPRRNNN